MSTQRNPSTSTRRVSLTPCERVIQQIDYKNNQFNIWSDELEALLNDARSDIDRIGTLRDLVQDLDREILKLKAEQIKLGCLSLGSAELSQDNQIILMTSSVRKKDNQALEIK